RPFARQHPEKTANAQSPATVKRIIRLAAYPTLTRRLSQSRWRQMVVDSFREGAADPRKKSRHRVLERPTLDRRLAGSMQGRMRLGGCPWSVGRLLLSQLSLCS